MEEKNSQKLRKKKRKLLGIFKIFENSTKFQKNFI